MLTRPAAAAAALVLLGTLAACGTEEPETQSDPVATEEGTDGTDGTSGDSGVSADDECSYPTDGSEPAKSVDPPAGDPTVSGEVVVTMDTSAGELTATLDADRTPCTVNNFVSLAEQDWFADTECHRLVTAGIYVLQCGDPTATGTGGPGYTIPDEVDGTETYGPGTLAMAKTQMPDSGGSQFFIVYDDSPLPPQYTVFGQVDEDGVSAVADVAADGSDERNGPGDGYPSTPVEISGVSVG